MNERDDGHSPRDLDAAEQGPDPSPTGRLVALLEELGPYLDSFGRAFCGGLGKNGKGRGGWSLDSVPVHSLLTYRYIHRFKAPPHRNDVELAKTIVMGRLWESRKATQGSEEKLPTLVRVLLAVADSEGDFLGSATEALAKLTAFARADPKCLEPGEMLTDSPDQLGVQLGHYAVLLRDHGVEVFRPQRKDTKRLWAWTKLRPVDDTDDTNTRKASSAVKSNQKETKVVSDTTDGFTAGERRLMEIYQGDNKNDRSVA